MIIVSLTTTSERFDLLRITLLSLLHQRHRADKIVVWISSDAYLSDRGVESVNILDERFHEILASHPDLVEFRFTPNTGPYRKLLPILQNCGDDDLIITADDDIFYGELWLQKLLAAHQENASIPVVARARKVTRTRWNTTKGYRYWNLIRERGEHSEELLVTFGGGAVLKKAHFTPDFINNTDFMQLAPTTDDIWFTYGLRQLNSNVFLAAECCQELYFIEHPKGLYDNYNMQHSIKNSIASVVHRVWRRVKQKLGVPQYTNEFNYRKLAKYFAEGR